MTADISRCGDNGLAKTLTQTVAELVIGNADAHTVLVAQHVGRQVIGTFIYDGQWLDGHIDQLASYHGHIDHIVIQVVGTVNQHNEGLAVVSLFELINFFYGFSIGSITTDTPNRIGWIKNQTTRAQHFQALNDIGLLFLTSLFDLFLSQIHDRFITWSVAWPNCP